MSHSLIIALCVSAAIHAAFLSRKTGAVRAPWHPADQEIEMLPMEKAAVEKEAPRWSLPALPPLPVEPPLSMRNTDTFSALQKDISVEKPPLPAWDKEAAAAPAKKPQQQQASDAGKEALAEIEEDLSVSREKMEAIKDTPAYMGYYNFIREKIKRTAMERYTSADEGKVTLVFLLSRTGAVKTVAINPRQSGAPDTLKKIGMESIRRASPFPAFPAALQYENLEFSITVRFKQKSL